MNKIRVIDLLNKIANREEVPEQFFIDEELCIWQNEQIRDAFGGYLYGGTGENLINYLNDEVEIIKEPKEIEKIGSWYEVLENESKKTQLEELNHNFNVIFDRLETLIDVVNELKKENK